MFGVLPILSNTSWSNKVCKRENVRHQTKFARQTFLVWTAGLHASQGLFGFWCLCALDLVWWWIWQGFPLPVWTVFFLELFRGTRSQWLVRHCVVAFIFFTVLLILLDIPGEIEPCNMGLSLLATCQISLDVALQAKTCCGAYYHPCYGDM